MSDIRLVGTDRLKTEIEEKLPISAVAERLCDLDLVASGNQYKACCPFHEEDTPSFYINDAKGVYHCFGCDAGGDYIDLVQRTRHVEFFEALYVLAAEADIEISKYERPLTPEEKAKDELRRRCEAWIEALPADPSDRADGAPDSMMPRQVSTRPDFLGNLPEYLFRGTLFPSRSPSGKLVGWRTRGPNKEMFPTPKEFALNERTLYGIEVARQHVREKGEILLVEGEFDAIAMHANGFHNTVAVGGHRLSDEQMEILVNLKVPKVVLVYDGDKGGHEGNRKTAERWWSADMKICIADLPEDEDPDDIVGTTDGVLKMMALVGNAKWCLEWLLFDEWSQRGNTIGDKLEFLEWVQTTFGSFSDVQETVVSQHIAGWLGLPEAQVLDFGRVNKSKLQATDSEQIVIGRCLRDRDYYRMARKRLDITDFYLVRHQRLWKVMEEMLVEDMDFEVVAIKQRAASQGVDEEYIDLVLQTGEGNVAYHEEKVQDLAVRRAARDEADRFRERIADTSLDAKASIGHLTLGVTRRSLSGQRIRPIQEQVDSAMSTLHERMKNPDGVHGYDIGSQFPTLTRKLQGFQQGRLVLVSAISGVGKTTITWQWAINFAVGQAIPCDYVSLEMDEEEMLFKAASHLTGISAEAITGGFLKDYEAVLVEHALARIRKSPLRIYAPDEITPSEFVLYARESVMEHRTELFFLDYAQLVSPERGSEGKKTYEQLKEFGRVAKMQVARGMNTCVICPAQLGKQAAEKERPTKEDMGDSYDLARTADVVMILKGYEGSDTIELWLDKSRQGPDGILIPSEFHKDTQTFHEHSTDKNPDYRLMESQA